MKHKVGDKVRIKSIDWYNKNKDMDNWVSMKYSTKVFNLGMSRLCGMTATIAVLQEELGTYIIDIDNGRYFWTDEMFDETYKNNKMESKKVKITLPKNCEVEKVETSVENGYLVVEYTPKEKFSPKDGDILSNGTFIVIYKDICNITGGIICYCYLRHDGEFGIFNENEDGRGCGYTHTYHLASDSEKEKLFSYMKGNGYTFNQKTKKIEKIRWVPKLGERYFYITGRLRVYVLTYNDDDVDYAMLNTGNYFQTKEEAHTYADKIKELLKNRP